MSTSPITRTVRQALILDLLEHNQVFSQMQLSDLLKDKGVDITQGTLSRDLDELGAKKVRPDGGRAYYAVGPVDDATVNAGVGIPVKFSLGSDYGLNIFVSGSPASQQVSCSGGSGGSSSQIEETVTTGNNSLQYDPTTQTYTYVWKTDKAWAGSCRQLIVRLIDGTEQIALFQFNGNGRSAGDEGSPTAEEGTAAQQIFLPLVNR